MSEFLSLAAAQISPVRPSITILDTDGDTAGDTDADADAELGRWVGA